MTHSSIDAALEMSKSHDIDPGEIDEVVVHTSKMVFDMVGSSFKIRDNPQVDAQFSIPYTVAVALERGKVSLGDFIPNTIKGRSSTGELSKKVKVFIDPELSPKNISASNMTIRMLNGDSFSLRVDAPKGSPSRPMTFDECSIKFKQCLEYSQKQSVVENSQIISDFIFNLEKKKDVSEVFEYL